MGLSQQHCQFVVDKIICYLIIPLQHSSHILPQLPNPNVDIILCIIFACMAVISICNQPSSKDHVWFSIINCFYLLLAGPVCGVVFLCNLPDSVACRLLCFIIVQMKDFDLRFLVCCRRLWHYPKSAGWRSARCL